MQIADSEVADDISRGNILMKRHRENDKEAFPEIYRWQHPKVSDFLNKRTVSKNVAEELSDDTFVKLFYVLALPVNPIVWLTVYCRRIARNLLIDHFRRQVRHCRLFRSSVDCFSDDPIDWSDAEYLTHCIEWTREAIAKRDEKERQVLRHVFVDGMTHVEVAAIVGVSRERIGQIVRAISTDLRKRFDSDFAV